MNNDYNQNPYATPQANVSMASNSVGELAERGTRLGAALLDGLVYMISYIPFLATGGLAVLTADASGEEIPEVGGMFLIGLALTGLVALGIFIYNLILLSKTGQTIGKKILGIKITRTDGSPAGLGRIFGLRMVVPGIIGAIPFIGGLIGFIGILLIFRENRRCMHDLIADTIVVKS